MNDLLIFGSGRSGTSMITGSLVKSGYFLGENIDQLGKKKSNPKGFFEDREINSINEKILNQNVWNFPKSIRKIFFPSHTINGFRWLARIPGSKKIKNKDAKVVERIQSVVKHTPFCFKDPRFSYTLPVWKPYLPADIKYLIVFREPSKTVESILRHREESKALKKIKINEKIAAEIWLRMYQHVLKNFEADTDKSKWFFIHYTQFFETPVIENLNRFTNADFDLQFAEKGISRSKGKSNMQFSKEIDDLYAKLCGLANYNTE